MNDMQIKMVQEDCRQSCIDPNLLSPLKEAKILVAGGTGFVGTWLCEMISFLNETFDFNTHLYLLGRENESFSGRVPHLARKMFVTLIEQDVRNLHELPNDVQWVINAAATPDSRVHVSQPQRTIDTIYRGTSLILDYCFRLPDLNKILHISSNQVYGKVEGNELISEDFFGKLDCNKFTNIYAEAKRISESICAVYRNQHGLPIVVSRPFAFIGPYQDLDKPWAVNNFIRDALMGGPIRILGNEKTVRSYLYGSDMAYWMLSLLVNGKKGEVYNTGSTEKITLSELARKIKGLVGQQLETEIKSSRNEYLSFSISVPDTTKIRKDVKVSEVFNLEKALERTIAWNKLKTTNHE